MLIFNENGSCELFDKFSKKGSNYDNSCYSKWATFKKKEENVRQFKKKGRKCATI